MSDLARRTTGVGLAAPSGFSRSEEKAIARATNQEVAAGIVSNTRLSVAHFLTATAMQQVTSLAKQGYALAGDDEYLASRLGALVDGYVQFAGSELMSLRGLR